jgi:hypothetical protein
MKRSAIAQDMVARMPEPDRAAMRSLIVGELRRLHAGVLTRWSLRPSKFTAWKARTGG